MTLPRIPLAILPLILALSATRPADAQCFLADGLDGPCCETPTLQLPELPDTTIRSKYMSWVSCKPALSGPILIDMRLTPVACGYFLNRIVITNLAGGLTAWEGTLVMTYSRTFAEASGGGDPDTQVWRFLLNGDLQPGADLVDLFGNNPRVVAPCFFTYSKFHVKGYIDYARDCATDEFSVAFAFDHDCDAFEHDNTLTCRPGDFHPRVSYTWVGPEAGFECSAGLSAPQGLVRTEAFREYDFSRPLAQICLTEQPINAGTLFEDEDFCPCEDQGIGDQYTSFDFTAGTSCGSSATSTSLGPWPGVVSKDIGFWTDPNTYPGEERLFLSSTILNTFTACIDSDGPSHFYGVHTSRGFPAFRIVGVPGGGADTMPATNDLLDLASSTLPSLGGAPAVGKRSIADKIIAIHIDPL